MLRKCPDLGFWNTGAVGFLPLNAGDVLAGDVLIEEEYMAKKNATRHTKGTANERQTAQYADQRVLTGAGGDPHPYGRASAQHRQGSG
jgi:hypothetical protein